MELHLSFYSLLAPTEAIEKKADDSTHTHKDIKISTLPIASSAYIEFLKRNNDFCEDNYNLPETTV